MDEVYAAGRYVFMDEPEIEELFHVDYLQEKSRRAQAAARQQAEVQAEQQPVSAE